MHRIGSDFGNQQIRALITHDRPVHCQDLASVYDYDMSIKFRGNTESKHPVA